MKSYIFIPLLIIINLSAVFIGGYMGSPRIRSQIKHYEIQTDIVDGNKYTFVWHQGEIIQSFDGPNQIEKANAYLNDYKLNHK